MPKSNLSFLYCTVIVLFVVLGGYTTYAEDVSAEIRADFMEYQNVFQKGNGSKSYFEANHEAKLSRWKERCYGRFG